MCLSRSSSVARAVRERSSGECGLAAAGGTELGSLASSPVGEGSFTLNLEVSYGICSTRDGASLASSSSV